MTVPVAVAPPLMKVGSLRVGVCGRTVSVWLLVAPDDVVTVIVTWVGTATTDVLTVNVSEVKPG